MMKRFKAIITKVNNLISTFAPDSLKKWRVSIEKGTVAFGSAYYNWGMSVPFMAKKGINCADLRVLERPAEGEAPRRHQSRSCSTWPSILPSPSRHKSTGYPTSGRATWSPSRKSMTRVRRERTALAHDHQDMDGPPRREVAVGQILRPDQAGRGVWALGGAKAERVKQVA